MSLNKMAYTPTVQFQRPEPKAFASGLSMVKPRFGTADAQTPDTAMSSPKPLKFNEKPPGPLTQWSKELFKNASELFFPPQQASQHLHTHAPASNSADELLNIVRSAKTYAKISGACFDRHSSSDAQSKHTHHTVYQGPVVHGHGEDQPTAFWIGENAKPVVCVVLDPGQKAVQVNLNLLNNYLKTLKDPLDLGNLPKEAYKKIKSFCFDFPNGDHTHHALYTGPAVTIKTNGHKDNVQKTVVIVGQEQPTKLLQDKGIKLEPDAQSGVLVTENLFLQGKKVQHG